MTDILLMNLLLGIPAGLLIGLLIWAAQQRAVRLKVLQLYILCICSAVAIWDCLTFRIQRKLRAERRLRSVTEEGGQHE